MLALFATLPAGGLAGNRWNISEATELKTGVRFGNPA
jgi:hypothetical protein